MSTSDNWLLETIKKQSQPHVDNNSGQCLLVGASWRGLVASTTGTHRWVKWPLDAVRRCAKTTVDIQDLRKELEQNK